MAFPSIEIEVDQLAHFMFIENKTDAIVELSLGGIEDNKDFFYFCHDLFCKGLVLLYGNDNRLIINDVTMEQFLNVKAKMANAGIHVKLDIINNDVREDAHLDDDTPSDLPISTLYPYVNIQDIELLPCDLELHDYKFEIRLSPSVFYSISFSLFHKGT